MPLRSRKPEPAAPGRLGPLAKLPVFHDLRGRRAVVAGGSSAAAWKAELLAAAGAHVEIYAPSTGEDMENLLRHGPADGSLTIHERRWTPDALDGAAIAVADAGDDQEAAAFAAAARAAGAPVNVIDNPAFCDFQFGAIVNRSPVVIGISTDGAAPILGQAIRQKIETLLHPSLALWAALARNIRGQVLERASQGLARRVFWERFAGLALGGRPPASLTDLDAACDAMAIAPHASGRVTLVGAGPGDAELLTLKAMRALQSADVILFDDLVSDDVLELARREARRLMVGKRGGRASCSQDDINSLMVRLALEGKHVVRLKSGDPMIFGRAGEEIACLRRAGVPVEIVSGVTAGIAAAASLGVSLTHREAAQSVRFVTGCAKTGRLPADLDWRGLADRRTTTIYYMAGATAREIAGKLMAAGYPADGPAVMVSNVSRAETRWNGPLRALGDAARGRDPGQPVLIGVGEVFRDAFRPGQAGHYQDKQEKTGYLKAKYWQMPADKLQPAQA
ncbi:siroheme synthase CysG [Camelimonas sp. ID_303_24]